MVTQINFTVYAVNNHQVKSLCQALYSSKFDVALHGWSGILERSWSNFVLN